MLELKNFSKSYDEKKKAVKNVSLKVNKGDILGFIGHNGAGKTTTIKSIIGLIEFTEGEILIDGVSVKENPIECKKKIAYIPDNPDIYESLTGIQYLTFIADLYEVTAKQRQELIQKYAEKFEITRFLGNLISSYSHGMKQKLVIISALIHKPKLLIMDEPFVGLDPKAIHVFKEIMYEMTKEGDAIFMSTHVLDVAERLCNKIVMINKGEIVIQGEVKKITRNRSLEEVFMGLVNNG